MGPSRYEYAGLRLFLRKASYPARLWIRPSGKRRGTGGVCVQGCTHCPSDPAQAHTITPPPTNPMISAKMLNLMSPQALQAGGWQKVEGNFISINVVAMACKTPATLNGMSPHAHISDGCLDLILVRDCAYPKYLAHLLCLANNKADHLDFDFVEVHKVHEVVFDVPEHAKDSPGIQSTWAADGELVTQGEVHLQALQNLIHVFACRPPHPPVVGPRLSGQL